LYVGERFTVVKDLNKELGPGLLSAMCKQLGIRKEDQATDCLSEAIAGRIARGDEVPRPSKPKRGQYLVGVPLYLAPKLALYLAMRENGVTRTSLAKKLHVSETVVRRMLNPKHDTKPEKIQAALAALGKRLVVVFEDAA
jgi:antitoxin HicB